MLKIRNSITRKVLVIFLLVTIGIVMTSFVAAITGSNRLLRDTSLTYTYQLLNEEKNTLADYNKGMQEITEAIRMNPGVRQYLFADGNGAECAEVLDLVADTRSDVTNIFVMKVRESGDLDIVFNDLSKEVNPYADYRETVWYENLMSGDKSEVLTSSYVQNLVQDQYNWVISHGAAIKDLEGKIRGIILIDLNYTSIESFLAHVMPEKYGYVYLVAENGEIVYHPRQQLIFNKVKQEDTSIVEDIRNDHVQVDESIYVVIDSNVSNWKIVAVLDSSVVYRNTLINTFIFLVIALIFIMLSFYISSTFSKWFTKPIRNMASQMQKVEQGDLTVRVKVESEDEIGHLGESFNVMTEQIGSLVDRIVVEQEEKRNYELNALRSQINPHFLYNTLDSIIWMAECDKKEEVVEMTSALSKMLRASINTQKSGVTLGLEIQNAVNYLKIQKYRYSNKLDYEIQVEDRLLSKKAAHLVLQPLVENSIYHGIKNKKGPGKITIKAFEEDGMLNIQVIDDGIGMTKERIEEVLEWEGTNPYGIGIANIGRRISLIYGEDYGLEIDSVPDRGTTITIRIPSEEINMEGDDLYDSRY